MNINSVTLILIVAAVVVAIGIAILFSGRTRRSKKLREKFGPEYDAEMEKGGNKHSVEDTLKERENRVNKMNIQSLDQTKRDRYRGEWIEIQTNFVDDPSKSVEDANRLITEVMVARGFPVADFDQRAADLSVMYPKFVSNYRKAFDISEKNKLNASTTEDLRQAMVYYHSMFDELLGTVNENAEEKKEVITQ